MEFSVQDLLNLVAAFASMAGIAALVSILVDLFKRFGLVQDGMAPRWSAALNLVFLIAVVSLHYIAPQWGVELIDQQAGMIAQIAAFVLSLVMQLAVSPAIHEAGLESGSVLAFSNSYRKDSY